MKESGIVSVRLPIEELERLKEAKWDFRKSVNAIVREAVTEYLDKRYKVLKRRKGRR